MSMWKDLDLQEKLLNVLEVDSHAENHHFGRPFLTPYQIAIRFKELYPEDFSTIGKPVGGKGNGQQDSLAQYLSLQLSKNIKSGEISNIEGRFLSHIYLSNLEYTLENEKLTSSSEQSYDLSMFRLKK
ncbi:hypothetical protein [Vibrio parahaemolyticus]|uniref:hypothetical protein n=1 Tax=Vibrio parahaemolyticus TaxID=670 RepID=UPI000C86BA45|nr:hypothetical protein [Vibrio parahaemolyticus]EIA1497039.1 hypothetical protein [Vibrio parahaemolyticus]ELA7323023.1 hypothetical protein [Vibrio parahaemolyticus]MBE3862440.1 hypothetical protein [Vibrio parahaemolyticus]PMT58847.1 hypothetical protein C1S87_24335 [Vibrio parahaemolyticus]PMT83965.1 hypothetical protein C1S83_24670 [Vibrio parahaemolyticus]